MVVCSAIGEVSFGKAMLQCKTKHKTVATCHMTTAQKSSVKQFNT